MCHQSIKLLISLIKTLPLYFSRKKLENNNRFLKLTLSPNMQVLLKLKSKDNDLGSKTQYGTPKIEQRFLGNKLVPCGRSNRMLTREYNMSVPAGGEWLVDINMTRVSIIFWQLQTILMVWQECLLLCLANNFQDQLNQSVIKAPHLAIYHTYCTQFLSGSSFHPLQF